MSRQGTVVEQKHVFMQTRKQLLSRGIVPSERLKIIAQDGGIEMGVLRGALEKVNRDLKQHCRRVYSRQMSEHVVEQIDALYWASGSRELDDETIENMTDTINEDSKALHQGDDLSQDKNIAKLPAVWNTAADLPSFSRDDDGSAVDQDDYMEANTRLQDLSAKRLIVQQKLDRYKTLLSLLEPYRKPKENIQPNLVWKDTPLAPELMKTRTLAIRVASRVQEKFGDVPGAAAAEEDVEMGGDGNKDREKVNNVLASW